jgi:hypothetical protein
MAGAGARKPGDYGVDRCQAEAGAVGGPLCIYHCIDTRPRIAVHHVGQADRARHWLVRLLVDDNIRSHPSLVCSLVGHRGRSHLRFCVP